HATVAAPGRAGVIKAWPHGAHRDLAGMTGDHALVEVFQVILAVMAAVTSPATRARLYPGVEAVKSVRVFRVLVLVDQQRRVCPRLCDLAHPVPVRGRVLGQNENYRTALIPQVSGAA